jgi:hypothetical protein
VPAWSPGHVATASTCDRSSGNRPSHGRSRVPAAGCRMNTENLLGMGPLEPVQKERNCNYEGLRALDCAVGRALIT